MTNLFSFPHWVGLSFHINMTTCSNFTVKCMSVGSVPSSSDWFPICLRGNTNTYFICGMSFLTVCADRGPSRHQGHICPRPCSHMDSALSALRWGHHWVPRLPSCTLPRTFCPCPAHRSRPPWPQPCPHVAGSSPAS